MPGSTCKVVTPRPGLCLKDYDVSIGLWGAHDFNMLWADRANYGSTNVSKQLGYQNVIEQFFSNGKRNPIDKIEVFDRGNHHPNEGWFGMSAFMTARSSLSWDLATEPFITYFNLGNGQFFNWMGERQNDNEWYNHRCARLLAYLAFLVRFRVLGQNEGQGSSQWFGRQVYLRRCLRRRFVLAHLRFGFQRVSAPVQDPIRFGLGDKITIRYKLIRGQADINLALSAEGAENTVLNESRFSVLTTANSVADDEMWVEKTFTVVGPLASNGQPEYCHGCSPLCKCREPGTLPG